VNNLTGDEIRSQFLSFFEEKGHKVMPSSSLIPHGDPTLLLTTAGMVQFKPYFMGEAKPPHARLTTVQKCFRTTDIESVGDSSHLTFFEMLGNFSVGDYFKAEAIAWAWELITQRFNIPAARLWTTVYLDDDEAIALWRKTGVPAERIIRLSEADNFWGPAGETGPCGPCSEIHYDFGADTGCGKKDCNPSCKCGRFCEIWNLVFMQFYQDKDGKHTPLPKPNIDTGMGLERITAIMQGKSSVYQTDIFQPLLVRIAELCGKTYGNNSEDDRALRVVAEHGRAVTFLITDGVLPSNDGRGYVLRRLLRRAALFGRRLGLNKPFLVDMARATITQMSAVYPELAKRKDFVLDMVLCEEERFEETLSTGIELLDAIISSKENQLTSRIPGEQAFKLYDTYGFPIELTREIASGRGLAVNMEGFEREMGKQREKARASHKFGLGEKSTITIKKEFLPTIFVGYSEVARCTRIAGIIDGNDSVDVVNDGQELGLVLESTPFYAEMGGQVGDTGRIKSENGLFIVTKCIKFNAYTTLHQGYLASGSLTVGDEVTAEVDSERRADIARNHTATHLLHYALRQVLGEHVQQRGSLVAPERLRFDFSHLSALTPEQIAGVQQIVNREIRANHPVHDKQLSYKEAIATGAIALFDEKYGDTVRVLSVGNPAVSVELCGGTHVSATGEIGMLQIIAEGSIGAGLRRVEAVTGREAERIITSDFSTLQSLAKLLEASPDGVLGKVKSAIQDRDEQIKRSEALERELALKDVASLLSQVFEIEGLKLLATRVKPSRPEILRDMADALCDKLGSAVVVLGTVHDDKPYFVVTVTPDLVAKGYHAGNIIRQVAAITGGGGGGKPGLAQGGGKDISRLDEAIAAVDNLMKKK
jgi:alanyl-tRNA synthetase